MLEFMAARKVKGPSCGITMYRPNTNFLSCYLLLFLSVSNFILNIPQISPNAFTYYFMAFK